MGLMGRVAFLAFSETANRSSNSTPAKKIIKIKRKKKAKKNRHEKERIQGKVWIADLEDDGGIEAQPNVGDGTIQVI